MGPSLSRSRSSRYPKEKVSLLSAPLQENIQFEKYADSEGTVSLADLEKIVGMKSDIYISYNSTDRTTQERVLKINNALKKRGIRTGLTEEALRRDSKIISNGIDNCKLVVSFITEQYIQKVDGGSVEDVCRTEFAYALRRKDLTMVFPVILESSLHNKDLWVGPVGSMLSAGSPYIDFSDRNEFEAKIDELCTVILRRIGTPINTAIENIDWSQLDDSMAKEQSTGRAQALAEEGGDIGVLKKAMMDAMVEWFVGKVKIVVKVAEKYASLLWEVDIGSIEKLKKKLVRNSNLLIALNFDEDDVEDIMNILLPDLNKTDKMKSGPKIPRKYSESETFIGHTASIFGIILLPDGHVATAGQDNTIRIWDVDTRQCVRILAGHTNSVDGTLCTGGLDKVVRLWNWSSGLQLKTFLGHTDSIFTVVELPGPGSRVCSGSADRTLRVWNRNSGNPNLNCVMTLTGHTDGVQFAKVLHSGELLSASWDRTLRLWNTSSGDCLRVLSDHSGEVLHVSQLSNGRILSSSMDCTIRVWDEISKTCEMTLRGHTVNARWTVEMDDPAYVCSASKDKTLRIWNLQNQTTEKILMGHTDYVRCLLYLPDGRILSGSDDKTMRIWF